MKQQQNLANRSESSSLFSQSPMSMRRNNISLSHLNCAHLKRFHTKMYLVFPKTNVPAQACQAKYHQKQGPMHQFLTPDRIERTIEWGTEPKVQKQPNCQKYKAICKSEKKKAPKGIRIPPPCDALKIN